MSEVKAQIERLRWHVDSGLDDSAQLCAGGVAVLKAAKVVAELRRDAEVIARAFGVRLEDL